MTGTNAARQIHFFKDKTGRIVIWQTPNIPAYGWAAFKILSLLSTDHRLQVGFDGLSNAWLFTWAFLEITQGVNYFRKLLGAIMLLILVIGFFTH